MKTKLLKKVRKRYRIFHYPLGVYGFNKPYTLLIDLKVRHRYIGIEGDEVEATKHCREIMLIWFKEDYK